jgi:hypothetical protein
MITLGFAAHGKLLSLFRRRTTRTVFRELAKQAFAEVCRQDNFAAKVYAELPDLKEEHWKAVVRELDRLAKLHGKAVTTHLRSQLAGQIDLLVTANWYTHLDETDRAAVAQHIWGSDPETQDRNYYFSLPYSYTWTSILEALLFNGWNGPPGTKEALGKFQNGLMDACQDCCAFVLVMAHAKAEERELTDPEREKGRALTVQKEELMRLLAGEEAFDGLTGESGDPA